MFKHFVLVFSDVTEKREADVFTGVVSVRDINVLSSICKCHAFEDIGKLVNMIDR